MVVVCRLLNNDGATARISCLNLKFYVFNTFLIIIEAENRSQQQGFSTLVFVTNSSVLFVAD
jgi:hypothetical protein